MEKASRGRVPAVLAAAAVFLVLAGAAWTAVASNTLTGVQPTPGKAAIERSEAALRETAPRAPKPAHPEPPPFDASAVPARQGGIHDEVHSGPFPGFVFEVTNSWSGVLDGTWVSVLAGGPRGDSGGAVTAAAVRVYEAGVDPASDRNDYVGEFMAPGLKGPLTIAAAVDPGQLSLTDASGQMVVFGVESRTFSRAVPLSAQG